MNKIIFRVMISILILFSCFIIYLGNTEFMINPKLIEKEYKIYED